MGERDKLYNDFLQRFPIEHLPNMTLEEYFNLERKDSFCYWLESKLDKLGSIWGGYAYKFGIYKYDNIPIESSKYDRDSQYAWRRAIGQTATEVFGKVREEIVQTALSAQKGDWGAIESLEQSKTRALGPAIIWKIAFLYSNKQLLPIYNIKEWLIPLAQYFGMPNADKASRMELQRFLLEKKGNKELFQFYEELLGIHDKLKQEQKEKEEEQTPISPTKVISTSTRQYWWLVASPDIWKFSDIKVGDTMEYTLLNENGNKRRIYQNFLDAKAGDLVIGYASTPSLQVVALGEIAKDTDEKHLYFRKTEHLLNPISYNTIKGYEELQNMECMAGGGRGTLFKLSEEEYQVLMEIVRKENPLSIETSLEHYSDEQFLQEVYMSPDDLQRLKALVREKKNIILQGAPGVGKTFTAKRLAHLLMGVKDEQRIEMVQFHQNYSYEDFILGYKPNAQGGFELRQGLFYKFCMKALNSPDKDFFFIIDEINRGNLSKIFGELLMLIENSYRGKEIKLAYTDEPFAVPDNLYIIGMMNTADRSLAMIDYALRRRFSFFEMRPGFHTDGFKRYQKGLQSEQLNTIIQEIIALNQEIRTDDSLGNGFCIGHSYFCNQKVFSSEWLKNVIEYDIEPMLREYWFDDTPKCERYLDRLKESLK